MSITAPFRPLVQAQTYRALLFIAVGIPIAAVVLGLLIAGWTSIAWLAQALGAMWAWQVRSLLAARSAPASPEATRRYRLRALWIECGTAAGLVLLMTIVWAATGQGYFWPEWVLLPLALLVGVHALVELVDRRLAARSRLSRGMAIHGGVVLAVFLFVTTVW